VAVNVHDSLMSIFALSDWFCKLTVHSTVAIMLQFRWRVSSWHLWQYASGLQTRSSLVHCYDCRPQNKLWSTQIRRWHHLDRTDITPSYSLSNMTDYLSSLLIWTADNDMQLNTFTTKEMILGLTDSTSVPSLSTPPGPIQRVTTFKLLGFHLDASLSWTTNINTIVSKASKR